MAIIFGRWLRSLAAVFGGGDGGGGGSCMLLSAILGEGATAECRHGCTAPTATAGGIVVGGGTEAPSGSGRAYPVSRKAAISPLSSAVSCWTHAEARCLGRVADSTAVMNVAVGDASSGEHAVQGVAVAELEKKGKKRQPKTQVLHGERVY